MRSKLATSAVTSEPIPPRSDTNGGRSPVAGGAGQRRGAGSRARARARGAAGTSPAATAARRRRRRSRSSAARRAPSYASRPKRRETNEATDSSSSPACRRHVRLGREARLALGREQLAALERVEVRRDHPGQPLRKRMQVASAPDERAVVLGPAADQLVAEAELLAQARRRAPCATGSCPARPRSRTRRRARFGSSRRARRRSRRGRRRRPSATDSSRRAAASPAIPPPTTDDPHAACAPSEPRRRAVANELARARR